MPVDDFSVTFYINGQWCGFGVGSSLKVSNPFDQTVFTEVSSATIKDAPAVFDAGEAVRKIRATRTTRDRAVVVMSNPVFDAKVFGKGFGSISKPCILQPVI